MKNFGFLVPAIILLFTTALTYAEEIKPEEWDKDNIPEGMEIQKVGDLRVLVPEDSRMRKVGDLLVIESPTEYYRRTMLEVKEDVEKLEKEQDGFKGELDELKKRVDEMQKKSLVSVQK